MAFDRSRAWERGALEHPAPWGASLPDVWTDTELTFYRQGGSPTFVGGGTLGDGAENTVLVVRGHAEVEDLDEPLPDGMGNTRRRAYEIEFATPDVAAMPRKGDRVRFLDPLGRTVDLAVAQVDLPEGGADHVEVRTEEFE